MQQVHTGYAADDKTIGEVEPQFNEMLIPFYAAFELDV